MEAPHTATATPDTADPSTRDPSDASPTSGVAQANNGSAGLLNDTAGFMERWNGIQSIFVDEPREAVARADALVTEVIDELSRSLSHERTRLEAEWRAERDVSTEDLRLSLQRYRDFFTTLIR